MKLKRIVNISLIVFFIAFSLLVCLHKFNKTPLIEDNTSDLEILELWHIESFEGGGANRQNYLNQLALSYQNQNPTTIVMVKSIDAEQLDEALKLKVPHLISFSEQVALTVLPYLKEFDCEYDVSDNYLQSAKYNGKQLAVPFIASGYCYFTKTTSKDTTIYTANNNLHSATSLVNNQVINNNQQLSSYQCYTKFVNSNNIQLLGTARDLFRIKNLESLGRFSVTYEPVSTFTDLIQYVSVTCNNKNALNFISYMLSDTNQLKLSNLSLFSVKNLKLYSEPTYMEMEKALTSCFVPNIFTA